MDLALSDLERGVAESARAFLEDRGGIDRARRVADGPDPYDHELWNEVLGLGWAEVAVAADHGGLGLGVAGAALLLKEAGRVLAPVPILGTVMASSVVGIAGRDDQRIRWLPELATGVKRFAVAVSERGSGAHATTRAEPVRDGWRLQGTKTLVVDGPGVDAYLVLAESPAGPLFALVPSTAVTVQAEITIDPVRAYATLALEGVEVPGDDVLLGGAIEVDRALDACRVAVAAELVGAAERVLELAVEYVREREQFGGPVGRYQGVSHPLARVKVGVNSARSLTEFAAWCIDGAHERAPEAASMAKAAADDACYQAATTAIQSFGGIGFTWETDPHFFLKRARASACILGGASWHRERLAHIILDDA